MHQEFEAPEFVALEGGDGVGKNTLAGDMRDLLAESGRDVLYLDYPTYWSPFGHMIRKMVSDPEATGYLESLGSYRESQVRAAVFAVERAFTISLIKAALNQLGEKPVIVSDRGVHSNAVTTAYLLSQGKLLVEELDGFISGTLSDVDKEYLAIFQPNPILCISDSYRAGVANRGFEDHYEAPSVQARVQEVYERMIPRDNKIITRENGNWRNRDDLARQAIQIARVDRYDNNQKGNIIELNPLYLINELGITDGMTHFAAENWLYVDKGYDPLNRKKVIKMAHEAVAMCLVDNFARNELDLRVFKIFPDSSIAMRRLIDNYPEILTLSELLYGSDFVKSIIQIINLHPAKA